MEYAARYRLGCRSRMLLVVDYGSASEPKPYLLLENQELVTLPFIRLANRQSSSMEYAVFFLKWR
jgi:hypothetical protein